MSPAEKNYTTTERECLPIIYACKKFRHYLLGYDVVFHTDHDAIRHLVNKADLSGRIARWIMLLQEFQYTIKVKPGLGNKNVDFLSRLEEAAVVESIRDDFPDEYLFAIEELGGPVQEPVPQPVTEPVPEPVSNQAARSNEEGYLEICRYLKEGILPPGDKLKQRMFMVKTRPYTLIQDVLYKVGS